MEESDDENYENKVETVSNIQVQGQYDPETTQDDDDDPNVYWNEPDRLIIKRSEYGGILPKDYLELDRMQALKGRFFYPDSTSLTWDVCARDRLHGFNLVCLKCGDVFACAGNNMTRTGNRHIKTQHPELKSITTTEPFYKQRDISGPKRVETVSVENTDGNSGDGGSSANALATLRIGPKKVRLDLIHFNRGIFDPKIMDRRVATLFARCNIPSLLVEHSGFNDFIRSCFDHDYVSSCAQDLETEQHHIHATMIEHLKNDLSRQSTHTLYSIALDSWTYENGLRVIALYIFFIDNEWKLSKATCHVDIIPKALLSHTIERILEAFPTGFGLSRPQIYSLTVSHTITTALNLPSILTSLTTTHLSSLLQSYIHIIHSPCDTIQAAYKSSIYGQNPSHPSSSPNHASVSTNPYYQGLGTIQKVLQTFYNIAQTIACDKSILATLADLCLQINPEIKTLYPKTHLNLRLDSELLLLSAIYRIKPVVDHWLLHMLPLTYTPPPPAAAATTTTTATSTNSNTGNRNAAGQMGNESSTSSGSITAAAAIVTNESSTTESSLQESTSIMNNTAIGENNISTNLDLRVPSHTPAPSPLSLNPLEWMVSAQLIALLSRIEYSNRILGKHGACSLSKVYPEIISLYTFLLSKGLVGNYASVGEIERITWREEDLHPDIVILKHHMAQQLAQTYPALLTHTCTDEETLRHLEPYLITMFLDPLISNTFEYFAHPNHLHHSVQLNSYETSNILIQICKRMREYTVRTILNLCKNTLLPILIQKATLIADPNDLNRPPFIPTIDPMTGLPVDISTDPHSLHHPTSSDSTLNTTTTTRIIVPSAAEVMKCIEIECLQLMEECSYSVRLTSALTYSQDMFLFLNDDHSVTHTPPHIVHTKSAWLSAATQNSYDRSFEIFWWKYNQPRYRYLSILAQLYLGIPASAINASSFLYDEGCRKILVNTPFETDISAKCMLISDNLHSGVNSHFVPNSLHNKDSKSRKSKSSSRSSTSTNTQQSSTSNTGGNTGDNDDKSKKLNKKRPAETDAQTGNASSTTGTGPTHNSQSTSHLSPLNMVIKHTELNDQLSSFVLLPWSGRLTHPPGHYTQDVKKILMKEIKMACEEALDGMEHYSKLQL